MLCCPYAVGAVVAAPVVLGAVGFTSAGIAAGSYAAGMMSAAAVANGGAVAAGSTVAVLQAVGKCHYMIKNSMYAYTMLLSHLVF